MKEKHTDGDSNSAGGLESADGGGTRTDPESIRRRVISLIAKAQEALRYGRRQEGEEASKHLDEAARQLDRAW